MPKTVRTAEQIRDELQNRMAKIAADVPGALRMRIPLPKRHPSDASGTWCRKMPSAPILHIIFRR
jgi:hypothetical protein